MLALEYHQPDASCIDPNNQKQCETNQRAVAGIFWDISEVLGKDNTKKLLFNSWKYLPTQCSERQGENLLVDVFLAVDKSEKELFNNQEKGRYRNQYKENLR